MVLRQAVIACSLLLVSAAHADLVDPSQSFEQVRVGEGIVAFIAPESNSMLVSGNSVAVIGDDGVLVVDSGHFPSLARREIAEIRRLTDKPVRFLVNTHWHPDHLAGNSEFRKAYPGVVIISTDYTRTQIEQQVPKYIGSREKYEQYSQHYRDVLRKGVNKDGQPLTADDRRFFEQEVKNGEISVRERSWEATLTLPDATFHDSMTVHLGKREVRLLWLGRGNTGGDAVIYVPDSQVVMTGDLVVSPIPYAYGSYLSEWRNTLHRIKELGATTIVPGHGPVQHDWTYIDQLDAALQMVIDKVSQGVAKGQSLEDIRKDIDFEPYRRQFCGGDAARLRVFKIGFETQATERAYQEARFEAEE